MSLLVCFMVFITFIPLEKKSAVNPQMNPIQAFRSSSPKLERGIGSAEFK